MRPRYALLLALLPASLAVAADNRPAPKPAATPTGEPVSCVPLAQIRESRIRDDWTIDFVAGGNRVWRNALTSRCSGSGRERHHLQDLAQPAVQHRHRLRARDYRRPRTRAVVQPRPVRAGAAEEVAYCVGSTFNPLRPCSGVSWGASHHRSVGIAHRLEHPFPLGDDRGRHRVADDVGGRCAHVEEGIDA
jgi:hypothetical protein